MSFLKLFRVGLVPTLQAEALLEASVVKTSPIMMLRLIASSSQLCAIVAAAIKRLI
jgi:hypothetical protein